MFEKSIADGLLKRAEDNARKVELLRDKMMSLSDVDLQALSASLRIRMIDGVSEDNIAVEAFAAIREASRRVCGKEPYFVQIVSGFLLLWGTICEQYTGEGKSLSAVLPAYVVGLTRKGCHIVTVNDYLVSRDAKEIGDILRWMGVSVGSVTGAIEAEDRAEAYACDVTYVTNNELGFDYLRDNMAQSMDDVVQRPFNYCIIDEADSVLIDEARTPLIISKDVDIPDSLYQAANDFVKTLERGEATELSRLESMSGTMRPETGDFVVDEKERSVYLTDQGLAKTDAFFGSDVFGDATRYHHVVAALRAHYLMQRDRDYMVKDGRVIIIDEFTGRAMPRRRYSDSLHQAIEAKEGVEIQRESRTIASITFQSLFNKYPRRSGMTGTAMTEAKEFYDIYGLRVVPVPTNEPMIRKDHDDIVFLSEDVKWRKIADFVCDAYERKQPVLVGTVSVDASEKLSDMLSKRHIPHKVLNAKHDAEEAAIIKQAGKIGSVTIATNMAGRGTDIVVEDPEKTGGLLVVGTERHRARRIDNQLRGRSGRQGDPGDSVFFVSLEDDVIRVFGSKQTISIFKSLGFNPDEPIVAKRMTKMIKTAQKHVEENEFGIRRQLMKFDETDDAYREIIYNTRRKLLSTENLSDFIGDLFHRFSVDVIRCTFSGGKLDLDRTQMLFDKYAPGACFDPLPVYSDADGAIDAVEDAMRFGYIKKQANVTAKGYEVGVLEHTAVLRQIDWNWMEYLERLDQLRSSIGVLGYGQKNIFLEYKIASSELFDNMLQNIRLGIIRMLFTMDMLRSRRVTNDSDEDDVVLHVD